MNAEVAQRLPDRLEGAAPGLVAKQHFFLVNRLSSEATLVDEHDFVTLLAVVGEDILQSAQVVQVGDLGPEFLAQLASNGLVAALAEVDGASKGTVEGLALGGVVPLGHQDAVVFPEDAYGYGADALGFHRLDQPKALGAGTLPNSDPWRSILVA